MISIYIQEQRRYTLQEISQQLSLAEDKTIALLKKLKVCNIVKAVKAIDSQLQMTELAEEDVVVSDIIADQADLYYVFTFVGVIVVSGRILKCYPKYLQRNIKPILEMKQILKVLEKYNSREQIIHLFTETGDTKSFNLLAVMLTLLNDFHQHGIYSNTLDIIESNGIGEILWDKTINETFALINHDRPYYTELQTHRRIHNDYDYFRRLHACILTIISKELNQTDLPNLFDIATVDLSEETIEDFGDTQNILDQIEKELNIEFNSRKQYVLKTIYSYLSHIGSIMDDECFAIFGTNSFNLVWESVCGDVLSNQLYQPIATIKLPTALNSQYNNKQRLIDLIEKPIWLHAGCSYTACETLIPDAVTIESDGKHIKFLIYDAKYYVLHFKAGQGMSGQPGIESITKQYLYQLAYVHFLKDHGINDVINSFLFPSANDEITNGGSVSLPMMDSLGLQCIRTVFLPAKLMYTYYIENRHLSSKALFHEF